MDVSIPSSAEVSCFIFNYNNNNFLLRLTNHGRIPFHVEVALKRVSAVSPSRRGSDSLLYAT